MNFIFFLSNRVLIGVLTISAMGVLLAVMLSCGEHMSAVRYRENQEAQHLTPPSPPPIGPRGLSNLDPCMFAPIYANIPVRIEKGDTHASGFSVDTGRRLWTVCRVNKTKGEHIYYDDSLATKSNAALLQQFVDVISSYKLPQQVYVCTGPVMTKEMHSDPNIPPEKIWVAIFADLPEKNNFSAAGYCVPNGKDANIAYYCKSVGDMEREAGITLCPKVKDDTVIGSTLVYSKVFDPDSSSFPQLRKKEPRPEWLLNIKSNSPDR